MTVTSCDVTTSVTLRPRTVPRARFCAGSITLVEEGVGPPKGVPTLTLPSHSVTTQLDQPSRPRARLGTGVFPLQSWRGRKLASDRLADRHASLVRRLANAAATCSGWSA